MFKIKIWILFSLRPNMTSTLYERACSSHKDVLKLSNGSKVIFFEHFKLKFRRQHGYSLLPLRSLGFQKRPLNLLHNFSVTLLRSLGKDLNEAECVLGSTFNENERFQALNRD
jgi:hypothetical protein